jgi:biotin operon repressor
MALQLLARQRYVSRAIFCNELHLGEGAIKTLISHLKEAGFVESIKAGTSLTKKGNLFVKKFLEIIYSECTVKKCEIAPSIHNHAIILKKYSKAIGNGMQLRDYAILYGAAGATTLVYKTNQFLFPTGKSDMLFDDSNTMNDLVKKLHPQDGDVVIIASADEPFVAKISAINSALWTMATHR